MLMKMKKAKTLEEINNLIPDEGIDIPTLFEKVDLRVFYALASKKKFTFNKDTRRYFKNES